jgi:hypothetical protein
LAEQAAALLAKGGVLVLLASPPVLGEHISRILKDNNKFAKPSKSMNKKTQLLDTLETAETAFFSDHSAAWSWNNEMVEKAFTEHGFSIKTTILDREEERLITEKDLDRWFDAEKSAWGKAIQTALGEGFDELRGMFSERIQQGSVLWRWKSLLFKTRQS